MAEPLIKIEKLNVVFDQGTPRELHALKNISFDVYPGEYVIIFGPSGCGKSTLLYHIAGLDNRITGGKIIIDGKDIVSASDHDILQIRKKKMGMIFQAYNLITTIKVIHNVALPLFFHGKNNKETIKQAEKQLDALGVLSQKDRLPSLLSGGQQQRVAISRALITEPDIVLADEPVGNLDFKSAFDVLSILHELNSKQGKTIIFVTHDMDYLQFADKIIYLWNGELTKVEQNKKKITPIEKFGDVEKTQVSGFTRQLTRSLVDFILEGEEKEALSHRIEYKMVQFFSDEMSWNELISFFSDPIRLGGLGFGHPRVKKIETLLKRMRVENNLLFFKYFHKIDKNDIVDIIVGEVDFELNPFQKERLADIIEFRVSGVVTDKNMMRFLTSEAKDKGVGLSDSDAEILNDKVNIFVDLLETMKTAKEDDIRAFKGENKEEPKDHDTEEK